MHRLLRVFGYRFICGVVSYASKNVATVIDTSTDIHIQFWWNKNRRAV